MSETTQRRCLTLIDASGFIFRAYHAIQHLSTSKGVQTNAVYGFTRMLLKTLREIAPTHVALAFDKKSREGRQAIDPTYKANREGPPDDLLPQFQLIRDVVEVLQVPILEVEGWEADDVIGTLSKQALEDGFEVLVITGDKDFIQIVGEHVRLYDPMQDKHTGPDEVRARLGIEPGQMRDYLCLVGDAIDNVPKVPGVGPKTAAQLLQRFGDVETLLASLEQVEKPKLRATLESCRESIARAKSLVSFRLDLPLDVTIDSLARRPILETEARALFSELEFFRLLQEMPSAPASPMPDFTGVLKSRDELQRVADLIREKGRVALTAAWDGPAHSGRLAGLGLALEDAGLFYVPFTRGGLDLEAASVPIELFIDTLGPALGSSEVTKVGYDLKAIWLLLDGLGVPLSGPLEDIQLLSFLLNPNRREHLLTDLARERLQLELSPLCGPPTKARGTAMAERSVAEVAPCLASGAEAVRRLAALLREELERVGIVALYEELEGPLLPVLARMERAGVRVDRRVLTELSQRVAEACQSQQEEIHRLAGRSFNVSSNPQLAQVLYEELGLPVLKRGKSGPSTDAEVLEKLSREHPLPARLLEYRMLSKLKSTYLDPLPQLVAADGRLHTTLHQTGAATGRLSSSDPNLQNIPIRTEHGRAIRRAFVAEPGFRLISADYSQIELRILAHVAQDPALVEAFRNDEDVHTRTAAEVFGVEAVEVTGEQRRAAKAVNFGIAYGLSPYGLSTRLDIPSDEAKGIIDRYFERYAGIRSYLDQTLEGARQKGYVETLFGRRRDLPDLHARSRALVQAAERAAINMPIQGTAADLIKRAMLRLDEALSASFPRTRMLLQVHDELLLEAPEDEVEAVSALVVAHMREAGEGIISVPLRVDVGSGESWADAH